MRIGDAHFADGVSQPHDGPNPRAISNIVVGEGDSAVANVQGFSGMMYAWGQFLDHDLDLTDLDGVNRIDVSVPDGDPVFPDGSVIPMTRVIIDPRSGTSTDNPAMAINAVTGWLDGSQIYGSTKAVADSLRLPDGRMKTSEGDNLPIVNGQYVAGDGRAPENPSLTALQVLFVREHNYQVDRLEAEHPRWGGERLYQEARAIVIAELANITYREFLPKLLGGDAIDPYRGYDSQVDPRISAEFAGAAYRFGHSLVSAETERIDNNGELVGEDSALRDTFFMSPAAFSAHTGADGFLRHLLSDASQAMDVRIVEDLRNFLFDPPVALDLASINIQRGRDLGLGTLNQTRESLGLTPYQRFEQITDDAGTVAALKLAFASVDEIDLWTGGLAEKPAPGAMVGETFGLILVDQFERLRDGDRFYFENARDARTTEMVRGTTLSDIIERNTDTPDLQDDAFMFAARRTSLQPGEVAEHPDAPQLVIGTAGTHTLEGGAKDDTLVAAAGRQTLVGHEGADIFRFHGERTRATITDFEPGADKLQFEGDGRPDAAIERGHTVITFSETTVVLRGVRLGDDLGHYLI
jgi:peroxidase